MNRCKKIIFPYRLLRPWSMAILLDCPRFHKLAVTTWSQVDKSCPVGSIFYHIFIQRNFNKINQQDTSVMYTISESFKGIVPSHGITQKWDFSDRCSLGAFFVSRYEATFSGIIQFRGLWWELILKSSVLYLVQLQGFVPDNALSYYLLI